MDKFDKIGLHDGLAMDKFDQSININNNNNNFTMCYN